MNLEQTVQQYRPIPLKALQRMIKEGYLTEPLDEKDQHALQLLSRIWRDEWIVARMNMSMNYPAASYGVSKRALAAPDVVADILFRGLDL